MIRTLADRLRSRRLAALRSGAAPVTLINNTLLVVHVLSDQSEHPNVDVGSVTVSDLQPLQHGSGGGLEFTFEGALVRSYPHGSKAIGYVQCWREGLVEAVDGHLASRQVAEGQVISALPLMRGVLAAVPRYGRLLSSLLPSRPLWCGLSLLNTAGHALAFDNQPLIYASGQLPLNRQDLVFPLIPLPEDLGNISTALRPMFDQLWNTGGYPRCPYYDQAGDLSLPA